MRTISVIIPVYNRPELLVEAAESVLSQTFDDFELIIVDDGSTDDTPGAAEAVAVRSGGRASVLNTVHTGFPGAARNRGAEAAAGEYLAFLDSDDRWAPEKLERQLALMKSCGSPISHTRELWRRGDKVVSQRKQKHRREGDIFSDALRKCIIGPSTLMMKRSYYFETGGFHERLEIAEDYEYWLRITCGQNVDYLDEPLTVKRAGDWPQLSEKYGMIELFRLHALAELLGVRLPDARPKSTATRYLGGYRWTDFPAERRLEAAEELVFKCEVWAAGCRKRGKDEEAAAYEKTAADCRTLL